MSSGKQRKQINSKYSLCTFARKWKPSARISLMRWSKTTEECVESGPVGERRVTKARFCFFQCSLFAGLILPTRCYCMFDRMKLFNNSAPLWRPVAFCVAAVGDIFGRSNYDIHARVFFFCCVFLTTCDLVTDVTILFCVCMIWWWICVCVKCFDVWPGRSGPRYSCVWF